MDDRIPGLANVDPDSVTTKTFGQGPIRSTVRYKKLEKVTDARYSPLKRQKALSLFGARPLRGPPTLRYTPRAGLRFLKRRFVSAKSLSVVLCIELRPTAWLVSTRGGHPRPQKWLKSTASVRPRALPLSCPRRHPDTSHAVCGQAAGGDPARDASERRSAGGDVRWTLVSPASD